MYVPINQYEQLKNGDCGLPTFNHRTRAPEKPFSLLDDAATKRLVESTFPGSSLLECGLLAVFKQYVIV
jgi:hypothetical protein